MFLQKLATKTISDRDYGAQEIALLNASIHLVQHSRNIETINPIEGSLPLEQRKYTKDSTAIPALMKYLKRPEEAEDETMFSLFQKYDVKYTTDAERVVNGGVKF
eukprot:Nk52_evm1s1946 gene=Nk52_evmTU1s1946